MLVAAQKSRDFYLAQETPGNASRQDIYVYEENEAGWPAAVHSDKAPAGAEAPLNWKHIVGREKGLFCKVDVKDVPELQSLIDLVHDDPALGLVLNGLASKTDDEGLRRDLVTVDTLNKVGALLNRAAALGDMGDANLERIYEELEPGFLAKELRGDLLFPIALHRVDTDDVVEIAPRVTIEPLSTQTQIARAVSHGADVNAYLVAAATHAIVLHDQSFDNSEGALVRQIRMHYAPPGLDQADLVFEAISIASGFDVGYSQVCIRPDGWADDDWVMDLPPISRAATVERYPVRLNDRGWLKDQKMIDGRSLALLPGIFAALTTTDRRAQLASRRLAQTSRRANSDDILIDACIGIEALLGEQHSELMHRMGIRAATALSGQGWDPSRAYGVLTAVYGQRSKIVHGTVPKKSTISIAGKEIRASHAAVYLLRELLRAHLSSTPPWTPKSLDAELFETLRNRGPGSPPEAEKARGTVSDG